MCSEWVFWASIFDRFFRMTTLFIEKITDRKKFAKEGRSFEEPIVGSSQFSMTSNTNSGCWERGDVISVIVDCEKHRVEFERNGRKVGGMKINPKLTYYPIVQFRDVHEVYRSF